MRTEFDNPEQRIYWEMALSMDQKGYNDDFVYLAAFASYMWDSKIYSSAEMGLNGINKVKKIREGNK